MTSALIHRLGAADGAMQVNAYLIESATGILAVDSTLTVSGGRAVRAGAAELGKPLLGVLEQLGLRS